MSRGRPWPSPHSPVLLCLCRNCGLPLGRSDSWLRIVLITAASFLSCLISSSLREGSYRPVNSFSQASLVRTELFRYGIPLTTTSTYRLLRRHTTAVLADEKPIAILTVHLVWCRFQSQIKQMCTLRSGNAPKPSYRGFLDASCRVPRE